MTWSLGWTGFLPPRLPPSISLARLAITSLAFMLVWVPEPVCQTTSGKCIVELAGDHFGRGRGDRLAELLVELAELHVGLRRRLLQQAEGADQRDRHALAADLEILQRPLGLRAPIAVGRHLDVAHGIGFDAGLR